MHGGGVGFHVRQHALQPVRFEHRLGGGVRVQGSGFRGQGSGVRVQGSGFRIQGTAVRPLQTPPGKKGPDCLFVDSV